MGKTRKRLSMLLGLMISVTFGLPAQARTDLPVPSVISNLNRIESLYFKYLNQKEQQEAIRLMNETRGMIVGSAQPTPGSDSSSNINSLSEEAFRALLSNAKGELSDSNKTKLILASLGSKGKIYMKQVEKLIQLYTFDDDKKNLLVGGYNNIVDPVNISTVLQYFRSSFTRDDVLKFYQQQ